MFASAIETSSKHGKRFTKEEDQLLKELAKDKKNMSWKEIASYLPGRTACQCRDRYNQYLFKDVVNKPWTAEEDEIIVKKYKQFGPHWVKISEFLPGRSGNNIKNHWNSALTRYHGISHKNPKLERRSRAKAFVDEYVSYNSGDLSSPETIAHPQYAAEQIIQPSVYVNQTQNQYEDVFKTLDITNPDLVFTEDDFDDFNDFGEFDSFAF